MSTEPDPVCEAYERIMEIADIADVYDGMKVMLILESLYLMVPSQEELEDSRL